MFANLQGICMHAFIKFAAVWFALSFQIVCITLYVSKNNRFDLIFANGFASANFHCKPSQNLLRLHLLSLRAVSLFWFTQKFLCKQIEMFACSKAQFTHRKIFLGQAIFLCLVSSHAQLMGSRQKKFSRPKKIFLCVNGPLYVSKLHANNRFVEIFANW